MSVRCRGWRFSKRHSKGNERLWIREGKKNATASCRCGCSQDSGETREGHKAFSGSSLHSTGVRVLAWLSLRTDQGFRGGQKMRMKTELWEEGSFIHQKGLESRVTNTMRA